MDHDSSIQLLRRCRKPAGSISEPAALLNEEHTMVQVARGDLPVSAVCYRIHMASDRPVREAENRLERFNADREKLLSEVERRVVARRVAESRAGGDASLEYVLNDVAYCEIKRLEKSKNGAERWRDLSRRLLSMSEEDKQA